MPIDLIHLSATLRVSCCALGTIVALAVGRPAAAQAEHQHHHQHADSASTDTAFAALQTRGKAEMGVDQYSSTHRFDDLSDGGRIELTRDPADSAGVRTIRDHLAGIARAFAAGDFSTPRAVHAREVPGTAIMAARRDVIHYEYKPLPGGGELRIRTADPEAVKAVHEFLAFQRGDHRAGGTHREH